MTFLEAMKALSEGKKIRCKTWDGSVFNDQQLYVEDGKICARWGCIDIDWFDIQQEWEICEEPKEKKRYWIFSTKPSEGNWYKMDTYFDEYGCSTDGKRWDSAKDWDSLEKIKHENEFIEV